MVLEVTITFRRRSQAAQHKHATHTHTYTQHRGITNLLQEFLLVLEDKKKQKKGTKQTKRGKSIKRRKVLKRKLQHFPLSPMPGNDQVALRLFYFFLTFYSHRILYSVYTNAPKYIYTRIYASIEGYNSVS